MRFTSMLLAGYLVVLTVALLAGNPFAVAGRYAPQAQSAYFDYVDFFAHVAAFIPLGWLGMAVPWRLARGVRLLLLAAYGGLTEAAQAVVPPRTPEWSDLIQNVAGLLLGAVLWWVFRGRQPAAPDPLAEDESAGTR